MFASRKNTIARQQNCSIRNTFLKENIQKQMGKKQTNPFFFVPPAGMIIPFSRILTMSQRKA